jgi:hypothetical protein
MQVEQLSRAAAEQRREAALVALGEEKTLRIETERSLAVERRAREEDKKEVTYIASRTVTVATCK